MSKIEIEVKTTSKKGAKGGGGGGAELEGSGFGKLAGVVAGGVAAGTLIADGVKGLIDKLADVSPLLKSVFKILDLAVMVALLPIANFVANLLKPVAMYLLMWAMAFNKNMDRALKPVVDAIAKIKFPDLGQNGNTNKAGDVGGAVNDSKNFWLSLGAAAGPTLVEGFMGLVQLLATVIAGAAVLLGGLILAGLQSFAAGLVTVGALVLAIFGGIPIRVLQIFEGLGVGLFNWFAATFPALAPIINAARDAFIAISDYIIGTLSDSLAFWLTAFLDLASSIMAGKLNFDNTWKMLTDMMNNTKTRVDTAVAAIVTLFSKLGTAASDLASSISSAISKIGSMVSSAISDLSGGLIGGKQGHAAGMDFVPSEGYYYLHRGEQVQSATGPNGGGQGAGHTYHIPITISGVTVNGNQDIDKLADQLADRIQRKISSKTTYGQYIA